MIRVTIDGRSLDAVEGRSVLQAWLAAGLPLTRGAGCMGQGVCGTCRVMVRRGDTGEVSTALACETLVQDAMVVVFLDDAQPELRHRYDLTQLRDGWSLLALSEQTFLEARSCRHCGGCDRACPKHIPVEAAVAAANAGQVSDAARAFDECVMCNLCSNVCPEQIAPNHLGLFLRRASVRVGLLPADLLARLHQIERGEMDIVLPNTGEGNQP